jgi:transcriptional regulator with XRE-family HTH domain
VGCVTVGHVGSLPELARELKQMRADAGLSVREAGRMSGLSPGTILSWESAKRSPLVSSLGILLRFYHRTMTVGMPPKREEQS